MNIIEVICNDKRYFSICKGISGQYCEDLYQEAMLQICLPEIQGRLEKAQKEGYLEKYVAGIIHNLWKHRKDPNNALYRITDNVTMWSDYKKVTDIQNEHRKLLKIAVNELEKKISSKKKEEREAAKLLWKVSQSNVYTVKKEMGCHSRKIVRRISPIITDIKKKLDE